MSSSSIGFVDAMLVSKLVDEQQVEHARKTLQDEGIEETTDSLADKMVELGYLTSYQTAQFKQGRTKLTLGPYAVVDWIGQGGMGHVFKAEHQVMGRQCAVKVLPSSKSNPSSVASFQHEIRPQAKLDHPNLVHAYDAGHDGEVHFLVTEYVPGEDLRKLVRRQGPLTMRQAANVFQQVALGLAHAHEAGLIHRDIKPGNILVTPDGIAKLSDLGLAGYAGMQNDSQKGRIVGTADYLSPEQIRSPHMISPVSDIYSMGCTLYYAVTGKVPFPGGSTRDKIKRHLDPSITVMHPRTFNPEISEEFVEIIADMMEKNTSERIQSAMEVVRRLDPWTTTGQQSPFPTLGGAKSPWTPPPIYDDDDQDTNVGGFDELDSRQESVSHGSMGTDPSIASMQDTHGSGRRLRFPPPPFSGDLTPNAEPPRPVNRMSRGVSVAIALAVAIPVSMLIGAIITFLLVVVLR